MASTISRRQFLQAAGAGLAAATLAGYQSRAAAAPRSGNPNIVYILADDMGYGDLSCLNPESKIHTPHMDRLARDGMIFTDAHSGSAVCTPTRYGILTGRYCWRSWLKKGVLGGSSPALIQPDRMTVASLLREAGYHTACIGKWHLGLGERPRTDFTKPLRPGPLDVGFDYFFGIPASLDMTPYLYVLDDRPLQPATEHIEAGKRGGKGFYRGGAIAPGFVHEEVLPTLTRRAVDYIDRQDKDAQDRPFFLYFALTAPHTPWVPTKEFQGTSDAGRYGDFVRQVDATVGQVLDALDRNGLAENTLVILTSDNGSHEQYIGDYGHDANYIYLGQKSDVWDGGHRVPFLARWPRRTPAGSRCDQTICLTDLMATAAHIVGAALPANAGEDSFTMLPALEGRELAAPLREATVHHSISGMFAIRQDRWKLILGQGSGGWSKRPGDKAPDAPPGQLYDMAADPGETKNLYNERPEVVRRLTALLEKYKQQGRSRPM